VPQLELFGGELLAIDGSKFAAVNARDQNFSAPKLQELIARADARLAEYLQMLDQADRTSVNTATLSKAELAGKIAALQESKEWHEELLAELQSGEDKQISVTDPDTRKMPKAHGMMVGYNAQMAVDAKHKLIAATDVTNEVTDFKQLANVALEAKANLELIQTEVVADAGYYNAVEVLRGAEQGITAYIPKSDTSANTACGLYGKSQFKYDPDKDIYLCPAGAELTYRFSTYELGRGLRYYRARGCKSCALKSHCTRNKANRTITREDNEALMEAVAARMKTLPEKFKLRKQLAEHPFGTIKRWFGYTHFLLKGLEKVRCEWNLMTLAYNLKRVLNLVSMEELVAAVA
jgi:transposase